MKHYRMYERLRVALMISFISGFINAYSFNTQGGIFAGAQSGNLIMLSISLAKGDLERVIHFILPLIFFILGQGISFLLRRLMTRLGYRWHVSCSLILLMLMTFLALLSPILPEIIMLAGIALFASILLDCFKRVRGMTYASVMMTGNVKNLGHHFFKGLLDKDKKLLKHGYYTFLIVLIFSLGVYTSTLLTMTYQKFSLYALLPILAYIFYLLYTEKMQS